MLRGLLLAAAVALAAAANRQGVPTGDELPAHMGDPSLPLRVDGARPEQLRNRPSLIDYNPVAAPGAVVISADKMARFTVLTPRLLRMEYAKTPGVFEDLATIAIMNRNLPVPVFTSAVNGGVLTITTSEVVLRYVQGQPFSSSSLTVAPFNASSSTFPGWSYGQAFPGNLLGTIRGLDGQDNTSLNCTLNEIVLDNGEALHCEWGLVSKDGWSVYDDSQNFVLDENDWWVPSESPISRSCTPGNTATDALAPSRSAYYPNGLTVADSASCCATCLNTADCIAWVFATDGSGNCWPLAAYAGTVPGPQRIFGTVGASQQASTQNGNAVDLYGFFHGLDFAGALLDFTQVSGKTIMPPRPAAGVWFTRWFDYSNYDLLKVVDDFDSKSIPLDTFVIDMNWHAKYGWSGFTFDADLYPFPADTMGLLAARGLPVLVNIHDAQGINDWEALFPELAAYLGLPAGATVSPMNLVNATVAYAVEDIVMADLVYNKSIAAFWIDWQQGGNQGGLQGFKQNPTIWLNHLRCTDRHRNGDDTRAFVLARWGGLGGHRYQVGFSGDVASLTWGNLAYQPYFSATAANVGHGFWSHDIEGPSNDLEMYTRWIQIGAFSGVMRAHERGMSAGGCADLNPMECSVVQPWDTPNVNFPALFVEANRIALQWRAMLLPYVYNGFRAAFDTGLGLIVPMYYSHPTLPHAYAMDNNGNSVQYMYGPSMLFSPVVAPANNSNPFLVMATGMAVKTTWLPPGQWVDAVSGVITTVPAGDTQHLVTKAYALDEVPLWYAAGSVIPYIPLRSLTTTVGNAAKQYGFLGFAIVPGGTGSGSGYAYEDDGSSTAYLTANAYATTTATYTTQGLTTTVTISTGGPGFPELPATRAYQLRLINGAALASVTVNGVPVPYNRLGKVASSRRLPPSSQHYWDFSGAPFGMGPVVDVLGVPTSAPVTIVITRAAPAVPDAAMSGVYGSIMHALGAKANMDIDRSTPGSEVVDPSYTSVLSSQGQGLEYLAGTSPAGFAAAIARIPALLANATAEVAACSSLRKAYSLQMLQNAAI